MQSATWRDHKATQEEHGVLGKSASRKKDEMSNQTHSNVRSCLLLGVQMYQMVEIDGQGCRQEQYWASSKGAVVMTRPNLVCIENNMSK